MQLLHDVLEVLKYVYRFPLSVSALCFGRVRQVGADRFFDLLAELFLLLFLHFFQEVRVHTALAAKSRVNSHCQFDLIF